MDQSYIPPMRMSQPTSTSGTSAYSQASHSPGLYQTRTMPATSSMGRRHSELSGDGHAESSYHQSYRRISSPYESMHSNDYSMAAGQTIPSISGLTQSPLPSPHLGSTSGGAGLSQYHTSLSRYAYLLILQLPRANSCPTDLPTSTTPTCTRNPTPATPAAAVRPCTPPANPA